jgi:hypothetical protein
VNPFTRALTSPFIGRRRDFYILTIPLNSKNIPSVNTHTQMSFTSHIFTSLPLVHTLNLDFLRRYLWLCFLLVRESPAQEIFTYCDSIILPNFTDSRSSWFRRFTALSLYEFATSRLRRFKIPSHRAFATPRLREFRIPGHCVFATPRLREFQIQDLREFFAPENLHHKFH